MSDDVVEKFWLSVGAQYTGPLIGEDSVMVLALCAGTGLRSGVQFLMQPLSGEYTDDQLRTQVVSREQVRAHAKPPNIAINEAMGFITSRAKSNIPYSTRPPVLLCADPYAEAHVRWYFRQFACFDPFTQGELAQVLSSQWNGTLRHNMDTSLYVGPSASDIAEAQFRMMVHLRGEGGKF